MTVMFRRDIQDAKKTGTRQQSERIKGTMHIISPVLWQFLVKWLTAFALFPPEASGIAPYTDALYLFLVLISLVGFGIVTLLVVGFSVMYRQEKNPERHANRGLHAARGDLDPHPAGPVHGGLRVGRAALLPDLQSAKNAMNIYIVGKQWMWKAEHPGGQHEINALHIPVGRPIQLTMISQDVFHSFSIPAFRVKREVIPGRYTTVWFEATEPGTYHLFCTQYCGTDHSGHDRRDHRAEAGRLRGLDRRQHQRQVAGAERRAHLRQPGMQCLPQRQRRIARGPSLANVYGSQLQLANGSMVHGG